MIQIIIIEDNNEIRNALETLVNNHPEFQCTGCFASAEDALLNIEIVTFDVALVDIHLPGISGIELIRKLKPKLPEKQFVIQTIFDDTETVFNALKYGATGYLLKSAPPEKIIDAINEVYNGGSPMSGQIARKVISSFSTQEVKNPCLECLSTREMEILDLLSKGFRYKEIGVKLFISTETVRTHIRNIYKKLQVESGIEAINKAFGKKSH